MNTLKDTYVIVKKYEGIYDFFFDFTTTNKDEADKECSRLTKEYASRLKGHTEFLESTKPFEVMTLHDALELFQDKTIDYHTEQDESY